MKLSISSVTTPVIMEYIDEHLLRPSDCVNVSVPYKQNRAVVFGSFLFHKSDTHKFKREYENRRINLTFLYGKKQSGGQHQISIWRKEMIRCNMLGRAFPVCP
mmetsp:Transcript_29018/g.61773  ORF Transcript_29018/g.61773 Transcript_29018/m.61773 type:complete len:103 (+) Transcript_29018:162-470(+)